MDDVTRLVIDLEAAIGATVPAVTGVVSKGALNVKTSAARRISGHPHLPSYPQSISYDLFTLPGSVRAEIGPDKDKRQGALGNIPEFGTVNNAPLPHLGPALEEEAPRFERALADLGARLLGG